LENPWKASKIAKLMPLQLKKAFVFKQRLPAPPNFRKLIFGGIEEKQRVEGGQRGLFVFFARRRPDLAAIGLQSPSKGQLATNRKRPEA
jgi:hypothetical protein